MLRAGHPSAGTRVEAPRRTAHSENCSQSSGSWPRTPGHGRRDHTGGQNQVLRGKDLDFVLKEEPLKAALKKMVLLAST